jgi:hypothetical protein
MGVDPEKVLVEEGISTFGRVKDTDPKISLKDNEN